VQVKSFILRAKKISLQNTYDVYIKQNQQNIKTNNGNS